MKRQPHKPPPWYLGPRQPEIDDRYQAEIDVSTGRLERSYRQAARRLAKAEARVEHAERQRLAPKIVQQRRIDVELRIAELAEIERLMQPGNTAPSANRGTKSFQKMPRR